MGLLAPLGIALLGIALLNHNDPDGYAALVAGEPTIAGRRAAEIQRYGVHAFRLPGGPRAVVLG